MATSKRSAVVHARSGRIYRLASICCRNPSVGYHKVCVHTCLWLCVCVRVCLLTASQKPSPALTCIATLTERVSPVNAEVNDLIPLKTSFPASSRSNSSCTVNKSRHNGSKKHKKSRCLPHRRISAPTLTMPLLLAHGLFQT